MLDTLPKQEATCKQALRGHDISCVGCSDGDCRWVETLGDQPNAEEYLKQTARNCRHKTGAGEAENLQHASRSKDCISNEAPDRQKPRDEVRPKHQIAEEQTTQTEP